MNKTKKECYDLALEIQQLQPWNYFENDAPIFIKMPDFSDVYVQILGSDKQIYGIAFYEGEEGLGDLLDMLDGDKTESELTYQLFNTSFIALYFDAFEDLLNPIYRDCVEKEFKDKPGRIPYFIELEKAYVPGKPQAKTFKRLKEYLTILKLIILKVKDEGLDYESDEIYTIYVDDDYKDNNLDSLNELILPFPKMSLRYINITCDQKRLKKCKKKKKTEDMLILDAFYPPFTFPLDENHSRETVPYFLNLISEDHEGIIDSKILSPLDNREKIVQNMLFDAIEKYGIPNGITIRREDLIEYILPIVNELDIDLYDMDWDEIDKICEELAESVDSSSCEK